MLEFLKKTFPYEKDEFNYEYDGYTFEVKNKKLFYRKGKSTPKYSGIFVTLWKKNTTGNIPYSISDNIDYLLVKNFNDNQYYLFSKENLLNLGILSNSKKGKMGFRLFSEDTTKNKKYIQYLFNEKQILDFLNL